MMHEGLLADILEHPEDDVPRLVLADWLEDHGQEERAAFIRHGCQYPERYWQIEHGFLAFRRPRQEWPDSLCSLVGHRDYQPTWRRGFIAEVMLPCAAWLAHGPELVRCQPIQRVRLSDKEPVLVLNPRGPDHWGWLRPLRSASDSATHLRYGLPDELHYQVIAKRRARGWDTAEEARQDLSEACLRWAKQMPSDTADVLEGLRIETLPIIEEP